jgi:hypothetical protein
MNFLFLGCDVFMSQFIIELVWYIVYHITNSWCNLIVDSFMYFTFSQTTILVIMQEFSKFLRNNLSNFKIINFK